MSAGRGQKQQNRSRSNNKSNAKSNNKRKKSKSSKKKELDPVAFWGDHAALPEIDGFEISTPDPVAVVNSLGQPPLPGHGAASPHYFKLVYGRATQLAAALGMAGGIDDLTPELIEEDAEDELEEADEGNQAESEEE